MSERPYPRYYSTDGTPARILSDSSLPEIYAGNGAWKFYNDRFDLMNSATMVIASEAQKLAEQFDAMAKA